MRTNVLPIALCLAFVASTSFADTLPGNAVRLAVSGPFELYAVNQPTLDGFVATTIVAHAVDPTARIVALKNVAITGDAHQTWFREPYSGDYTLPTPFRIDASERYNGVMYYYMPGDPLDLERHHAVDTHLILPCGVNTGPNDECQIIGTVSEANDLSNPGGFGWDIQHTLDGIIDNFESRNGIGELVMSSPDDQLILPPGLATRTVEIAYIVTPSDRFARPRLGVNLTLELLGVDGANLPLTETGRFGLDAGGPLPVVFIPEPSTLVLAVLASLAIPLIRWRRSGPFCPNHHDV